MKELIKVIQSITGLKCHPFSTSEVGNCIVYTDNLQSDDGAKSVTRLELRIIGKDIAFAKDIQNKLLNGLVDKGDLNKIENKSITLNGGGMLRDGETGYVQIIMYLQIIGKSNIR